MASPKRRIETDVRYFPGQHKGPLYPLYCCLHADLGCLQVMKYATQAVDPTSVVRPAPEHPKMLIVSLGCS